MVLLPYDYPLWAGSVETRAYIPTVRLVRMLYVWPRCHFAMLELERGEAVSFLVARLLRMLHVFFWSTHALGCALFACARRCFAAASALARSFARAA